MTVSRNWDGPDIIDFILQENTAKKLVACKFLTKKLWEFFACQSPAQPLVDELAQVLFDNDMAILPWVRAMLVHDEFYSTNTMQGLVRSPVDFVVAVEYFTGYRSADIDPQWYVEDMGQVPYNPPNVAGWKTNGYWVNTSVFGARAEFARNVTWNLRSNDGHAISDGLTPDQAVDALAQMFGLNMSTPTRTALVAFVTLQRQNEPWVGWWEATNLLTMGMMTPEMHVA